jgi:hypothetical protein
MNNHKMLCNKPPLNADVNNPTQATSGKTTGHNAPIGIFVAIETPTKTAPKTTPVDYSFAQLPGFSLLVKGL